MTWITSEATHAMKACRSPCAGIVLERDDVNLAGAGKLCVGGGVRISLDLVIVHRTSVRQPVISVDSRASRAIEIIRPD